MLKNKFKDEELLDQEEAATIIQEMTSEEYDIISSIMDDFFQSEQFYNMAKERGLSDNQILAHATMANYVSSFKDKSKEELENMLNDF